MDPFILIKLRQEITKEIGSTNFDKATINKAIENAFVSFENKQSWKNSYSGLTQSQSFIVNKIVINYFQELQKTNEIPFDYLSPIYDELDDEFSKIIHPLVLLIKSKYPNIDQNTVKGIINQYLNK